MNHQELELLKKLTVGNTLLLQRQEQNKAGAAFVGESAFYKQFYIYEFLATALAAGGSSTDQIEIEADADFTWVKSSYEADLAGVAQTDSGRIVPNVNIQITDTGSGRNFFNAPIPIPNMAGTGEIPFILPIKQMLRLKSVLQCVFTSFEAAVTPTIRISIIGYKTFKTGPTPQY